MAITACTVCEGAAKHIDRISTANDESAFGCCGRSDCCSVDGRSQWRAEPLGPTPPPYNERRERIATAVLAGFAAGETLDLNSPGSAALAAIWCADALLAELDKPTK